MRPTRLRPAAALVAASVLLLTGCGVAGTNFHPGVAATVGDDTITSDHVDELVTRYCSAIEQQLSDDNQIVPLSFFRSGVAGQLALRSAAEQLGDLYGVGAGAQYKRKVAQITDAVSLLDQKVQDAVIEIETSADYISDIEVAVGSKQLRDRGTSDPDLDQATTLGETALKKWIDDNGVEINPGFGVELKDGQPVPLDTSVSYAVSDSAKKALADNPDQAYAATLPSSSRCG